MKKIVILAIFVSTTFFTDAQKLDASKVPAAVKQSFEKQYPNVIAKWEKEKDKYEVNFTQKGNNMSVLIEPNGNITETEMDIKIADLPATVLNYVKEHYKGKTIKEGAKITKTGGAVNYEAEVAGTDILFDSKGTFIKESKD